MSYRIQSVSKMTGIAPATLRAWERRYRLVDPGRTAKGYRLYTEGDVSMLSRLKQLVDGGLKIGEAVELVRRTEPDALPADADSEGALDEIRDELLDALMGLDRHAALRAYGRLAHVSPVRQVDEALLPILAEVGRRWEAGQATVPQEHFATAFVRERMVLMLEQVEPDGAGGAEAVLAGLPGERHEMGLLAAALHLAARNWRVVYLGPDLPVEELRPVLERRRPALFCTSLVFPMSAERFGRIAEELRSVAPPGTQVVFGGAGVPHEALDALPVGVRVCNSFEDMFRAA